MAIGHNVRFVFILLAASLLHMAGYCQSGGRHIYMPQEIRRYAIQAGNLVLELNPQIGGRITALKIDGHDFLTDSSVNDFNWGSTFWPSPQSDWHWPPPASIDNLPYSFSRHSGVVTMISRKDSATGLIIKKQFSGSDDDTSFTLIYTIINQSNRNQKIAPWEVTRVKIDGLTFFPVGDGQMTGGLLPQVKKVDGIYWYQYRRDLLPEKGDRQFYADGSEGWVAYIVDGNILVKKFEDVSVNDAAPKEGEVELFVSPLANDTGYVEVENQGKYTDLLPGHAFSWRVKWFLRRLPAGIRVETGNRSLVAYVRSLVR